MYGWPNCPDPFSLQKNRLDGVFMNKPITFQQFLAENTPSIALPDFLVNLLLTFLLAFLVSTVYVRCGKSISNRRVFARNLTIIAMTTMLIITIVKSSLALSLGLVGALSIVRFRTPIKEPEELAFLFLSIAVGLGLGAGQRMVTVAGCVAIVLVLIVRSRLPGRSAEKGLHMNIATVSAREDLLTDIIAVLDRFADAVELRRVDETATSHTSDFFIVFSDVDCFMQARKELTSLDENLQVSFIDSALI